MKIANMRKGDWNKTKAFFDIETNEGMVVKGFKLVEGSNGLFMSNPSHYSKKDDKWFDDVFIPKELKDEMEKKATQEYGGDTRSSFTNDDPF